MIWPLVGVASMVAWLFVSLTMMFLVLGAAYRFRSLRGADGKPNVAWWVLFCGTVVLAGVLLLPVAWLLERVTG